jgi:signal transduction histidine kinase
MRLVGAEQERGRAASAADATADLNPVWLVRFRSMRPPSLVALGRLFLAVFALFSVNFDTEPSERDATLIHGLILGYLTVSIGVILILRADLKINRFDLITQALDIVFFSVLIHLTEGAASPFFVYYTFSLLVATLRWGWRGALYTTLTTLNVYAFLTLIGDSEVADHVDRIIVRASFLIFAGTLFCYFAAIQDFARKRLAHLAAWPVADEIDSPFPPLEPVLAHAADILQLSGLVVIWRGEEDGLWLAVFCDGKTEFVLLDQAHGPLFRLLPTLVQAEDADALSRILPEWVRWPRGEQAIVKPLTNAGPGSCIIAFRQTAIEWDVASLIALVAMRVGAELERHLLRRRLLQAAVAAERARFAEDIHDDLLQALTAAALQLKVIENCAEDEIARQVHTVRDLVSRQQRQLRQMLTGSRQKLMTAASLSERLVALCKDLEAQWSCEILVELDPLELLLPEDVLRHVALFITEAVANGVRHAGAARFDIKTRSENRELIITVRDYGMGIRNLAGAYDHEEIRREGVGSASLMRRAQDQGWRMHLHTSERGTTVTLNIPLADGL